MGNCGCVCVIPLRHIISADVSVRCSSLSADWRELWKVHFQSMPANSLRVNRMQDAQVLPDLVYWRWLTDQKHIYEFSLSTFIHSFIQCTRCVGVWRSKVQRDELNEFAIKMSRVEGKCPPMWMCIIKILLADSQLDTTHWRLNRQDFADFRCKVMKNIEEVHSAIVQSRRLNWICLSRLKRIQDQWAVLIECENVFGRDLGSFFG